VWQARRGTSAARAPVPPPPGPADPAPAGPFAWTPQHPQVRYAESPKSGPIATISNADKTFEAHFQIAKLSEARFALVDKPGAPGSPLRVVRLINAEGGVAMSVMLHQPGPDQAAAWDALRARYGDAVQLQAAPAAAAV
jgi:hypothetical protein